MSTTLALRPLSRTSLSSAKRFASLRTLHVTSRRADEYPNANLDTFNQVVNTSGRVVLVDFYADWCMPCHQLSPILSKVATSADTKTGSGRPVDVVKIDTDDEKLAPLAQKFKVRALPTVVAFRDGEVVDQFVGALPEPRFVYDANGKRPNSRGKWGKHGSGWLCICQLQLRSQVSSGNVYITVIRP
ncbi:putative thioredoxin-like domain containing protein [Lyophyllum shimeji]|uniref:Thioredoxin-like domain containing protein n=1 Tax=Lyophyllum shimeji TaxID=47721 RepID=A0A9P3UKS4_LYOSH|nr:putative thioredoxin-like domain containing protein [Lyophyllum shimeji]